MCVTTCFCGKKVRTRCREKQNGHGKCLAPASIRPQERASTVPQSRRQRNDPGHPPSKRGLQDTPCTNPEVEAHSRSCSTGTLLANYCESVRKPYVPVTAPG